jgi:hypothetical protein
MVSDRRKANIGPPRFAEASGGRPHAAQAVQTGSPHQVEKESLSLVVGSVTDHRAFWQYLVARLARTRFEVRPWLDPHRQRFEGRSERVSRSFDDGRFLTPARAQAMVNVHGVGNTPAATARASIATESAPPETAHTAGSPGPGNEQRPSRPSTPEGQPQFGRAHLVFGPQHRSDGLSGTSQGDHCSAALVHAQRQLL